MLKRDSNASKVDQARVTLFFEKDYFEVLRYHAFVNKKSVGKLIKNLVEKKFPNRKINAKISINSGKTLCDVIVPKR